MCAPLRSIRLRRNSFQWIALLIFIERFFSGPRLCVGAHLSVYANAPSFCEIYPFEYYKKYKMLISGKHVKRNDETHVNGTYSEFLTKWCEILERPKFSGKWNKDFSGMCEPAKSVNSNRGRHTKSKPNSCRYSIQYFDLKNV